MKIRKIANAKSLYYKDGVVWVSKGTCFFGVNFNGKRVTRKYNPGTHFERIISHFRILRQGLRIGIHHFLILNNGDFFVTLKKRSCVIDANSGNIKYLFSGYIGNKPGHQGVEIDNKGIVYFCEYALNNERKLSISLFKSSNNGEEFKKVYTFPPGTIRHIHFIKYDKYDDCLWMGTGDNDNECLLMKSINGGVTWITVGYGSQKWRCIGVCVTEKHLIWGTDAGHVKDENYLLDFDKQTNTLSVIGTINGPCHGCTLFDGKVYFSTGVEGGANEKDRYARLFYLNDGHIVELQKFKKDIFPFVVQYGVIRFPGHLENSDNLIFNKLGLFNGGESTWGWVRNDERQKN